jgi:hypothetical protein
MVTSGVKSVNAVAGEQHSGAWFSTTNSAAFPRIMQFLVPGLTEQSGSALTDQQGEPVAEVQLRIAPVVLSWSKVHP